MNAETAQAQTQEELQQWARNLPKEAIHKGVLVHEQNPLGEAAVKIRPVLMAHFEAVDYRVDVALIKPLLNSKTDLHTALFWQVVFGCGDFVEQHPEQAKEWSAYTEAGL
jgi:hypothetical protein